MWEKQVLFITEGYSNEFVININFLTYVYGTWYTKKNLENSQEQWELLLFLIELSIVSDILKSVAINWFFPITICIDLRCFL